MRSQDQSNEVGPKPPLGSSAIASQATEQDKWFQFTVGHFQVQIISDGFISVPDDIFAPDVTNATRHQALSRLNVHGHSVHTPTNIPVLKSKDDVILFDIGAGSRYQPTDGKFLQNMLGAGVNAEEITKIVLTHAHPDHIAAMLGDDGRVKFPNAVYFISASEWDFWMDPDFFNKVPSALHGFGRDAQRDLGAIKDRVVMLEPGHDVVSGIRAMATPGHTPGHMSFEIAGQDGLIISADAATSEIVAFEHPEWKFGYDTIPDVAIQSRKRLIDQAANDRTKLLGFHWTYPGVGFAEVNGSSYRFIPV